MPKMNTQFTGPLVSLLSRKRITHAEFAKHVDITRRSLARIFTGVTKLRKSAWEKAAAILGLTLAEFRELSQQQYDHGLTFRGRVVLDELLRWIKSSKATPKTRTARAMTHERRVAIMKEVLKRGQHILDEELSPTGSEPPDVEFLESLGFKFRNIAKEGWSAPHVAVRLFFDRSGTRPVYTLAVMNPVDDRQHERRWPESPVVAEWNWYVGYGDLGIDEEHNMQNWVFPLFLRTRIEIVNTISILRETANRSRIMLRGTENMNTDWELLQVPACEEDKVLQYRLIGGPNVAGEVE